MIVKLLTEHHLEFLSLKGGCRALSESTLVKMSNCLKSHAAAQFIIHQQKNLHLPNTAGDNKVSAVYFMQIHLVLRKY